MNYVFIDESGNLGKQDRFFVIVALVVDDCKVLDNIVKNARRNKFKRELGKAKEIKANKSSSKLISYILQKLNIVNIKIFGVVLDKSVIKSDYLLNDKNKLYNFVSGKLMQTLCLNKDSDVEIRLDKSKGKQILRDDFNQYVLRQLRELGHLGKINLNHSYSHSWSGLQIADIVSWSVFQKYEREDSKYFNILKNNPKIEFVWSGNK